MPKETCSSCTNYIQGDDPGDLGCCLLCERVELVYGDSACERHEPWFPGTDEPEGGDV